MDDCKIKFWLLLSDLGILIGCNLSTTITFDLINLFLWILFYINIRKSSIPAKEIKKRNKIIWKATFIVHSRNRNTIEYNLNNNKTKTNYILFDLMTNQTNPSNTVEIINQTFKPNLKMKMNVHD